MKIEVEGYEHEVMSRATQSLSRATNWAVMLENLHMEEHQNRHLSQQNPLFVSNVNQQRLVRVKTKTSCAPNVDIFFSSAVNITRHNHHVMLELGRLCAKKQQAAKLNRDLLGTAEK